MTSDASREVGDRLRAARKAKGLSQEQLALEIEKRQATISDWEQGHTSPQLDDLYLLAGVLDCSIHELLPDQLSPPPRAITRAIDEQLPLGAHFQGSLDLFLRVSMIERVAEATLKTELRTPTDAAKDLLSQADVTGPAVDVIAIARKCGSRVVGWGQMDESLSGLLIELEDGPLIAFNGAHPLGRQRFTIAHELGHLVLGHLDTFHVDLTMNELPGPRPGYSSLHEKEANAFAASLLMPEAWIKTAIASAEAPEVAQQFGVSELALGFRLMALGVNRD